MFKVEILHTDAYSGIYSLEDESIDIVITSPPYYKQRDYGFEKQIGQEATSEEYILKLTEIFSLLREKLSPKGVFFLNIGDKYLSKYGKSHLAQIPYRLGYQMENTGWRLLDILIWFKPNHMPSPVKDRFTNSYEPVLVFAKNQDNYYRPLSKIMDIPLEATSYRHTAVFPKKLVMELLKRIDLKKARTILDPFAGTGTVAEVAIKLGLQVFLIEPLTEFIETIKKRLKAVPLSVRDVPECSLSIEGKEEKVFQIFDYLKSKDNEEIICLEKNTGFVKIFQKEESFLTFLNLMRDESFKKNFLLDALFFIGCEEFSLRSLSIPYVLLRDGYVLRNMLVVKKSENNWFPIFMFAFDTKLTNYCFNLSLLLTPHKNGDKAKIKTNLDIGIGTPVVDNIRKRKGVLAYIITLYEDNFPLEVKVLWEDGKETVETILHPKYDVDLREAFQVSCPFCNGELFEWYSRAKYIFCRCGKQLWKDLESVPLILEKEISLLKNKKEAKDGDWTKNNKKDNKGIQSKYYWIDRSNWGASPGARKKIFGDSLTMVRFYNLPQQAFARFLKIYLREKKLTTRDLIDYFGKSYFHTIPHWIREDFGGSLPNPSEIEKLEEFLGKHIFFSMYKKTSLKVQTVKPFPKGKLPADFICLEDVIKLNRLLDN